MPYKGYSGYKPKQTYYQARYGAPQQSPSARVSQAMSRSKKIYQGRAGYQVVPRSMGVFAKGEMKYFDTERAATVIPASVDWTGTEFPPNVGTPNTICSPTVGSAINQRIGREVKVMKIAVKGFIICPAQADASIADAPSYVRVALVEDTQTNATQAQGEEIFAAPTTASANHTVVTFQSLANLGRFIVHKDKIIVLQNPNAVNDLAGNIEQAGLLKPFKMKLNFKVPRSVRFNAVNGGTISDVVDRSFCVYAVTSNNQLNPTIIYNARCYYKE